GGVRLSESEWRFVYSRSPGPGGQNVNKVNSRVTLLFDVGTCAALSPAQKRRIIEAFPGRVSREGTLRVVSSRFRTQAANRNAARLRFAELLTEALTPAKPRKQTTLPARARVQRLADKAHRSQQKHLRRRPAPED
ncbi:MAG: alternative ribosome rescue aminoacyl-tRNA hydrolase ArfB, partial [Planctomycetota bacterium]